MDHPAVGGRHRVESDRPAAGDGALSHALCQRGELSRPPFAVLFDVQYDAGGVPFASAERKVDEELKGAQGFTAMADEQTGVAALDIDHGHLFAAAGAAYGGRCVDVHPVEEAPHDAERDTGRAVASGDGADADLRVLRPDAEDPGAAVANDVDFEFVAIDAELQGCELDRLLHCFR